MQNIRFSLVILKQNDHSRVYDHQNDLCIKLNPDYFLTFFRKNYK